MAKWVNLFILKVAPDWIIDASAKEYVDYYNVPPNRCWSTEATDNWRHLRNGCFHVAELGDRPTVNDKIMLVAHGAPTMVGCCPDAKPGRWDLKPDDLANTFMSWGLTAAGLITFKCCQVGKGNYLEQFVGFCRDFHFSIGWLKAYTGDAATETSMWKGKPTESITEKTSVFGFEVPVPIFGANRYKIVHGTQPYNVPDSRYLFDVDDNRI